MEENQVHIPNGWKLNKLGAVCRIKKGVQFNRVELTDSGMYPCINGGIEPSGYSDLWNTNENTITISEGGNSCGFVNLITTKFWSGGHCYSLLDLRSDMENDFLYQALKGRQNLIMDLRVGSGLPNIQQKAIKEFEFLSPENPTEQTTIARILSKVDEAIAQTEQLIAKYTRIKTGLMQDLLTKGIDQHGNIRSEQTHEFKDSSLGRIPKEWEYVKMEKVIVKIDAGKSLNCPNKPAGHNQWGIIKVGAINKNGFKEEENKVLLNEKLVNQNYIIRQGNFLISRANTAELVGEVCLVEHNYNNLLLSDKSLRIEFDDKILNKRYAFFVFIQQFVRTQIEANSTGTSGSMKNISQQKIRDIAIFFPSSIIEQSEITGRIDAVDAVIRKQKTQLSKLQSLKTGLMQDLLIGKVRVNHLIKETASV